MTLVDVLPFLALTGAFGCALVSESIELVRAIASRRWPVDEAEILSAIAEESGGRRRGFVPAVTFRYQHQGRGYFGSRLQFGSMPVCSQDEAAEVVARFSPGTQCAVSIDPKHPHRAVIQPGPQRHNWVAVCALAGFTAVSAWAVVQTARDVAAEHYKSLPAEPALERRPISTP